MWKQKKVQRKFEYSFISLHANKADSFSQQEYQNTKQESKEKQMSSERQNTPEQVGPHLKLISLLKQEIVQQIQEWGHMQQDHHFLPASPTKLEASYSNNWRPWI